MPGQSPQTGVYQVHIGLQMNAKGEFRRQPLHSWQVGLPAGEAVGHQQLQGLGVPFVVRQRF